MTKQYTRLVYLETRNDVDEYARNNKANMHEDLCIAMNPFTFLYAKGKKMSVQSTLPYFTNSSHEKMSVKTKEISDWIGENINFVDTDLKVKTAYINTANLWMRFAVGYCLYTIEIISNSCDLHKPKALVASLQGKQKALKSCIFPEKELYVQPGEKCLGSLVKRFAINRNLDFNDISSQKHTNRQRNYFQKLSNSFSVLFLLNALYLQQRIRSVKTANSLKLANTQTILFTTPMFYMKKIAGEIKREKRAAICYLQESLVSNSCLSILKRLIPKRYAALLHTQRKLLKSFSEILLKKRDLFSYKSVLFTDVIGDKFSDNIAPYILGLHVWAIELNRTIKSFSPSLVCSSGNRTDDLITAELCRRMNIPSVFISHGSFVYPKNEVERIEWGEHGKNFLLAPFSSLALQSPLCEGYLKEFNSDGKIVKTGPLIWGMPVDLESGGAAFKKIFAGKFSRRDTKVIVHAGTSKACNSIRFHVYETSDEYIQSIKDLASAVEDMPGVVLVVKFRPTNDISTCTLKQLIRFSEKVVLSTEESFLEVLSMSDLLVSFSSTTIEEALQNRIPVLQYGGGGRYQHIPGVVPGPDGSTTPSAVYHVRDSRNLKAAITGILGLNIKGASTEDLFKEYIYGKDVREPLTSLVK